MIISFEHYVKTGKVKKKTPDPEEAKALLNQAQDRLEYVRVKEITTKTAKFIFEGAYEAAREAAQALMSRKGYKPYSHEATISFVKEFYADNFTPEDIAKLDYFRELRHDSVYRAAQVLPEDASECVIFVKIFITKVIQI